MGETQEQQTGYYSIHNKEKGHRYVISAVIFVDLCLPYSSGVFRDRAKTKQILSRLSV